MAEYISCFGMRIMCLDASFEEEVHFPFSKFHVIAELLPLMMSCFRIDLMINALDFIQTASIVVFDPIGVVHYVQM